jgi:uncharacterized membrane protein
MKGLIAMLIKDIQNMEPDIRRQLDVSMAVALLEDLFNKGEISEATFKGIEKDAKKIIDTKDGI